MTASPQPAPFFTPQQKRPHAHLARAAPHSHSSPPPNAAPWPVLDYAEHTLVVQPTLSTKDRQKLRVPEVDRKPFWYEVLVRQLKHDLEEGWGTGSGRALPVVPGLPAAEGGP